MGRDLHYVPGSFYRVDDRTGFPTRAERTQKEWNGLIVSDEVWEARQPQDLVKGVKDKQSVPQARPLAPAAFVGPTWTTTTSSTDPQASTLDVASTARLARGSRIAIMTDTDGGTLHYAQVTAVGAGSITFVPPIPGFTSAGAQVWNYGPGDLPESGELTTEDGVVITTEDGQPILAF